MIVKCGVQVRAGGRDQTRGSGRGNVQDTPFSFATLKMAAPRPAPVPRTRSRSRITAPQLEQFIVVDVQLTEVSLGAGAYGSVEEVEIPGARVAAKKLHTQLINLGSPQQVSINYCTSAQGSCLM